MRFLGFIWLMPRNIAIGILFLYRKFISPLYGDVCRYYPSCSSYALQSIQRHGLIKGVWLGSKRLARCHPWAKGGIDDVPESRNLRLKITAPIGFVVCTPGKVNS